MVDKYLQRMKFLMTEGGISQKLLFDGMMERLAEWHGMFQDYLLLFAGDLGHSSLVTLLVHPD